MELDDCAASVYWLFTSCYNNYEHGNYVLNSFGQLCKILKQL